MNVTLDEEERAWRLTWLCTGRPRGSVDLRAPAVPAPPAQVARERAARQLGAAIKERREALSVSAEELAGRVGITPKQVWSYEGGRATPRLHVLLQIAIALSTTISALLEEVDG